HLLGVFLEGIVEKVEQELVDKIYQQMKSITHSQILNDKQSLIASVLISLAEQENINDYIKYIHNPKQSIKSWIAKYVDEFNSKELGIENIIKNQIDELIYITKDFVEKTNRYLEINPQHSSKIQAWIDKFRELAENRLIFRNLEKAETFGSKVKSLDFEYIKNQVNEGLESKKSELIRELRKFSELTTSEYSYLKENVANKIIESVIGCIKACPFCGEICIHGKDHEHDIDHETPYHRPQGVKGYKWETPSDSTRHNKLITETCSQNVAAKNRFRNSATNDEWVSYEDYRKVNEYYGSWKINSDLSADGESYWKWFMATYSSKLATYYGKKEPDIHSSWKKLTKEQEIEKLRKLIEGDN
ncbi:MAG: hypothetical protein AB4372_24010, partial [Xenococcus sp. (in: cyanobacteria)]